MAGTYKATSHMGVACRLWLLAEIWGSMQTDTHLARQHAIVWNLQPCVSWMLRAFQRMTGAMIQAQKNCQKTEGHLGGLAILRARDVYRAYHSQPRPWLCFFCSSVPVTSVPGMPNDLWNLRETRYMKTVRKN